MYLRSGVVAWMRERTKLAPAVKTVRTHQRDYHDQPGY